MSVLKKLEDLFATKLAIEVKKLEELNRDEKAKWDIETGRMFNDLVSRYPVSEEQLYQAAEYVCKFLMETQLDVHRIKKYFFLDEECESPRLPYMLDTMRAKQAQEWTKSQTN